MKAIERIVTGYVSLKNRKALEEIRDHRTRLLNENRMRSSSGINLESLNETLQEEIEIVEVALIELQDESRHSH